MMKIIDITDDDNYKNDDISVIYETPKASKGKEKKFIENYLFSKPSSSGTKKELIDLSKVHDDNFTCDIHVDEKSTSDIEFLGTRYVRNPRGRSNNFKSIHIDDDNFTCDIRVDEKSTSDIEFLGTRDVRNSRGRSNNFKSIHIDDDDDNFTCDIHVDESSRYVRNSKGRSNFKLIHIDDDDDEVDDNFTCDICVDEKRTSEIFKIMGCMHSYCKECMARYVGSKIQENVSIISCTSMGCNGVLEPYNCRSILPKRVFDRWGDVLCEAMILGSEKFYCPFKDCSALLLIDESARAGCDGGGGCIVTQSECPECRRLFCAKCKVGWHSGFMCEEFEKLNKDEREKEDLQLMQLAKGRQWQRCPRCRVYVERSDGCAQMQCRCGCYFCYKCGAESTNHYCKSCGTLNTL